MKPGIFFRSENCRFSHWLCVPLYNLSDYICGQNQACNEGQLASAALPAFFLMKLIIVWWVLFHHRMLNILAEVGLLSGLLCACAWTLTTILTYQNRCRTVDQTDRILSNHGCLWRDQFVHIADSKWSCYNADRSKIRFQTNTLLACLKPARDTTGGEECSERGPCFQPAHFSSRGEKFSNKLAY